MLTWNQMIKIINDIYEEEPMNQEKFFRLCDLMGVCSGKKLLWNKWKYLTNVVHVININKVAEKFIKETMDNNDELKKLNYNAGLTKQIRLLSWIYNYGADDRHPCISCEIDSKEMLYLHKKIWAGGHIKARAEKGTHNPFINIVPICTSCNTYMGTRHMAEYIQNPKGQTLRGKFYNRDFNYELQLDRNKSIKQFNCKSLVELYNLIYNTYLESGFKGLYDLIEMNEFFNEQLETIDEIVL